MDGVGHACCGSYGSCPHQDPYSYASAFANAPAPSFMPTPAPYTVPPAPYPVPPAPYPVPPAPYPVPPMSAAVYPPPCAALYRVVAQPGVPLVDSLPSSVNNMHVSPHNDDTPGPANDRRPKRVRDVSTDEEDSVNGQCHSEIHENVPQLRNKVRPKMPRVNSSDSIEQEVVQVDDESPQPHNESFDTVEPELESLEVQTEEGTGPIVDQNAIVIDLTNMSDEDINGANVESGVDVVESRPTTPQPPRSSSRQSRSSSTLDSQAHRRSESASSTQQHREPIASPLLDGSGRPSLHRCARGSSCIASESTNRRSSRTACRHQCSCPVSNAHVWCASYPCPPCPIHTPCSGHCAYPPPPFPPPQPPPPPPQQNANAPYGNPWDSANVAASVQGYIGNYHTIYGYPSFFTAAAAMPPTGPTLYVSSNETAVPGPGPPRCTAPPSSTTPLHMHTPFHRRNHLQSTEVTGLSWPEVASSNRHSTPRPDPVHNMAPQHRRMYHNQQMQQQSNREYIEHYHQQQRRRHAAGPVVFHGNVPVSDPPPMVQLVPAPVSQPNNYGISAQTASAISFQFAAAAASHTMHAALNAQLGMHMEGMFNGVHAIRPSFPQPVNVSHPLEAMAAASHGGPIMPMEQRHYVLVAPSGGPYAQQVFPTASVMTAQNPIELNLLYHPITVNGFEGDMPPIGVTVEVIERVTRLKQYIKPNDVVAGEEERCTVCLSEFETQEHVRLLQCAHFFHKSCIDRWLIQNKTCPVCRVDCDRDKPTHA